MNNTMSFLGRLCVAIACFWAIASPSAKLDAQTIQKHVPQGIVSDWTSHHVLYPHSGDYMKMAQAQKDSRYVHAWYARHPEQWWPEGRSNHTGKPGKLSRRDWSFPLGTTTFEPLYDFSFSIGTQTGYGSLNVADQFNGSYLSVAGSLTVTGIFDIGTYPLEPGGPGQTTSISGAFTFNNLLFPVYPVTDPVIDLQGLMFRNNAGFEVNIWGNGAGAYEYDDTGYVHDNKGAPLTVAIDPGGGQTFPAKFVFDVSAAPSCTSDYIALGIPSNPASGGQANIIGLNNLYTGTTGYCAGSGPGVMFAYASGAGEVPADVVISQGGTRIAYVENRLEGSSYFHSLTIGTTGNNGTSATSAVVPGVGNNAVDNAVLLSPDGGTTTQSSTNSIFVVYPPNSGGGGIKPLNSTVDFAFASTYSTLGGGSGYLYKVSNIFTGTGVPAIVWSVPINAIPSTPVYDSTSNRIFFTDSLGRIDSVTDSGSTPSVFYGPVVAAGTTSENPIILDSTNQKVYATFNSNGTNAVVVQAPTSLASSISVPVGTANTTYTGPYTPDFNNAFYTGTGTPQMYVAGTGTGTLPTLYTIGFDGSGNLTPGSTTSAALATGMADSSPITEYFDASANKDYIFVGVTNHCVATQGGTAGCALSLDITGGVPTVGAGSTALAAAGGTTGIIIDDQTTVKLAPSIYYATKSGQTLVRATQNGLN